MFRKLLLAAAGIAALAAPAFAGTISYTGYTVLNNQNVTLTDSALGLNETGGAGQITLTGANTPTGTLNVWCVDIMHYLQNAGSFGTTGVSLTPTMMGNVNSLITHGSALLSSAYDVSAAIQVAIWKMEYGSALTVSGSSSMLALAQTYIGNVTNGTWLADPNTTINLLNGSGTNQNQASASPVPEPASLLALGSGLAALVALRRRRAKG